MSTNYKEQAKREAQRELSKRDDEAALASDVRDAARNGQICRGRSCHSLDDVRTVIGADGQPLDLCARCRKLHLPIEGEP